MKKFFPFLIIASLSSIIGVFIGLTFIKTTPIPPTPTPIPRPLDKYTIDNLSNITLPESNIHIEQTLEEKPSFTSSLFNYNFDPTFQNGLPKKVTGLINVPNTGGTFPLIVMIRGYVDSTIYQTGVGTQHAGEFFANNGFITLAPDFLGYGGSDQEPNDVFEARFQTYTAVIALLKSIKSLQQWDRKNIFIWAHSNGGQIAFTTLVTTKVPYPTVLWAPVSKPFPYSILYYTDDAPDAGKALRAELSNFEQLYDVNLYSFDNYLDRIKAPIQLSQGTVDTAVPKVWSDTISEKLKTSGIDINYLVYPNADHNLQPTWSQTILEDLNFFKKHLQ